ncbi:hypothetical protein DV738_g5213, partial [Chaetothyriales sp. CBS 135597]
MPQAPCRLSQTIWTAFTAARPARFYSDSKSGIPKDAESSRSRIGEIPSEQNTPSRSTGAEPEPTVIFIPPADDSSIAAHTEDAASADVGAPPPSPTPPSEPTAAQPSLQARFAAYMDNVQSYIFTASQRLNDLTGYSNIQALKDSITAQEAEVAEARAAVKTSRAQYSEAIKTRSETQREVNDLLHRKLSWTPEDVEKFTRLYRSDHANEQAEQNAQQAVTNAEQVYEEASTRLGRTILARYHEEQIWSDKIRQMSTWGTWGLMGINILLFIILQVLLEPWRRRRLVRGFEEKAAPSPPASEVALPQATTEESSPTTTTAETAATEAATLLSSSAQSPATAEAIADQTTSLLDTAGPVPEAASLAISGTAETDGDTTTTAADTLSADPYSDASPQEPRNAVQTVVAAVTTAYARSEAAVYQLFSEQPRVVTQKALTTLALEAAATGAVVTGLLVLLIKPR